MNNKLFLPKGFTLIELMIGMAVGLVLLAAVYSVFLVQNKELRNQEQITEMQQNARMAMEMMSRDLMMAGYGPSTLTRCTGTTPTTKPASSPYSCLGIVVANINFVSLSADLNGNGVLTDAGENLTYDRYESPTGSGNYALGRTSNGTKNPVVDNVSALTFTYYKADGTVTDDLSLIRNIKISITTRTANVDPSTGNYREFTLTSTVTPRNLMLSGF
ncbi:MAG: prepilin-type N-terminal cleavage/methylation domain-containing protein [Desulfobacterales bacterium]|nr:prepilin-type N-terminal cleavage/methylation domain-containing protein [Desulfobacterales bacterium]